jgi:hypothetical protein
MNERPKVDMSQCKPGQKLRSKHGIILEFVGYYPADVFPYRVVYSDGGHGYRTVEGWVFRNNVLPEDHDIVEILPVDK